MDALDSKERRVQILRWIYERSQGDPLDMIQMDQYPTNDTRQAVDGALRVLSGQGLIETTYTTAGGGLPFVRITAQGVEAAENAHPQTTEPRGAKTPSATIEQDISTDPRKVFVVHGRNLAARDAMFRFLRAIDLQPLEWEQSVALTGNATPYIGEVLAAAFGHAQAVVVLMTPDETVRLRPEYAENEDDRGHKVQPRPNVIFEAGLALAYRPTQTVLVQLGVVRPISDIGGLHIVHIRDESQWRQQLATRLKGAGCAVNTDGSDWLHEGVFVVPKPSRPAEDDSDAHDVPAPTVSARFLTKGMADSDCIEVRNTSTQVLSITSVTAREDSAIKLVTDQLPWDSLPPRDAYRVPVVTTDFTPVHVTLIIRGEFSTGDPFEESATVNMR